MLSKSTFNNLVTVLRLVVQGLESSFISNTSNGQQPLQAFGGGGLASAFLLLEILHTHYTQSQYPSGGAGTQTAALPVRDAAARGVNGRPRANANANLTSPGVTPTQTPASTSGGDGSGQSSARASHTVSPKHDAAAQEGEGSRRGSASPAASSSESVPSRMNSISRPGGPVPPEGSNNLVSTFGTIDLLHSYSYTYVSCYVRWQLFARILVLIRAHLRMQYTVLQYYALWLHNPFLIEY